MNPRLLALPALLLLAACAELPRLPWGAGATGATPPLLPADQLPAPAAVPDPGVGLAADAAALQARASALRAR